MAEQQGQTQLVLAQNQHALIQDATKGTVSVYAGPTSTSLSPTDRPVIYDHATDRYVQVSTSEAIKQNPLVPEGHYLVLENPVFEVSASATDEPKLRTPKQGANSPTDLQVGRKIIISGAATFPLWPGQFAQSIAGHHLRSNQYLVVRVYNADQANQNCPSFLKAEAGTLSNGQMLVIKGTDSPFFIPPTGFEVLTENNSYVREALTLERLEYCILLDEDGNKRYERGPNVVFPEATERFMLKSDKEGGSAQRKFKAIELNDQMGLYAKVIADYTEKNATSYTDLGREYKAGEDRQYGVGEELFITGKTQRIYYPRPEHALIEYDDPKGTSFKRQRYYGIAIPKGEGRYVLDKNKGAVEIQVGSQIFLPDPRYQVIVRRVLDDKEVNLWYPNNPIAVQFNQSLRSAMTEGDNYVTDANFRAAVDTTRSMNRQTKGSDVLVAGAGGEYGGDSMRRGGKFTPPPMLTLNTKYEGVPSINVWTGYAVQVVSKGEGADNRKIVVGPATILLEYDQTLEMMELSTGKPKNTDRLERIVYLRVDNNIVSDVVDVETSDFVNVKIKLSYRVNFLREHMDKWFAVENYVKYLCDHLRSILKAEVKKHNIQDILENSSTIIRTAVLGAKEGETKRRRFFAENGMEVYDVEVLSTTATDERVAEAIRQAQMSAVRNVITLHASEQNLEVLRRQVRISEEEATINTGLLVKKEALKVEELEATAATTRVEVEAEVEELALRTRATADNQKLLDEIATAELTRQTAVDDHLVGLKAKDVEFYTTKMGAISDGVIEALNNLANTEALTKLTTALAPIAVNEQMGLGATFERLFKGTGIEPILENLQRPRGAAKQPVTKYGVDDGSGTYRSE